jgi:hypothetical protein
MAMEGWGSSLSRQAGILRLPPEFGGVSLPVWAFFSVGAFQSMESEENYGQQVFDISHTSGSKKAKVCRVHVSV